MDQSAGRPGRRGRGRGDCPTTRSAPRCIWARRPWRRTCRGCGPSWTRRTGGRSRSRRTRPGCWTGCWT